MGLYGEKAAKPQHSSFRTTTSIQTEIYLKNLRVLLAFILHRKARSGNGDSRTIGPMQSGVGPSSKTTTATGKEWSCENRSGSTKEKPPKTTTSTPNGHTCQHRNGWPCQGASYLAAKTIVRASQPEAHLSG